MSSRINHFQTVNKKISEINEMKIQGKENENIQGSENHGEVGVQAIPIHLCSSIGTPVSEVIKTTQCDSERGESNGDPLQHPSVDVTDAASRAILRSEPDAKPRSVTEDRPRSETDSSLRSKTDEAVSRSEMDTSSRSETDASSRSKTEAFSTRETEASSKRKTEASSRNETDASSRSETEAISTKETEASSRSETYASSRSETEAISTRETEVSSRSETSLSQENEEKPLTDPPDLHAKKSYEIFSGFNSTLNRIEDLVKTDRDRSSSVSRDRVGRSPSLNLGSLSNRSEVGALTNRSDNNSYRSNSSIGYRYEDSFSSKYTSPYTTNFSGNSTARGSSSVYEPKYTPRSSYGSSVYSTSKYESSRNFSSGILNRYGSSENLMSSDLKGSFRGSMGDLSLSMSSRHETKRLEDKIRELEAKVKKVEQENDEYSTLVQELSKNFPNDDQLREIKRKVTGKIAESIIMARKEHVKVARIEPFSSESKRSNSINVKYDFTDGKSIPKDIDKKNVTYDIHVNVVRNVKTQEASSDKGDSLIDFSPSAQQNSTSIEQADSNNLSDDEFRDIERRKSCDVKESVNMKDTARRAGEDDAKNDLVLGDLSSNHPFQSEEVVFSTKKSSSLSLPDWMKLRRRSSGNQSNRVVKEVIQ